MKTKSTIQLITALTLGMHLAVFAAEDPHKDHANPPVEDSGKEYPLEVCVVSGESLKDGFISTTFKGQEVRLCCKECKKDFEKKPNHYLQKIRHPEKHADAADPYPIDTCVVSRMKLGSMGDPYVHKVGDKEVRFCCKGCLPKFEKNPEAYLKKLETAEPSHESGDEKHDAHKGHHH